MTCGNEKQADRPAHACGTQATACGKAAAQGCGAKTAGAGEAASDPLEHFGQMLQHCHEYALAAKMAGRKVVGILCEFTPREVILAAGAVPVCLCGGSAGTIPAAEKDLPANLCPLIKSTYGYHVLNSNPFLKMADLVIAETTCDGKKKMYELMARTQPMHVLALPQKVDDEDAREQWVREVRKLKDELERRFGVEITECKLREAIRLMNRERQLRRQLAGLMKADAPLLTGRELITLKSSISGIPADLAHYERAIEEYGRESGGGNGRQEDEETGRQGETTGCGVWGMGFGGTATAEKERKGNCGGGNEGSGVRSGNDSTAEAPADKLPGAPSDKGTAAGEACAANRRPVRVLMTGVPMAHGAERVLEIVEGHGGLVVAMENCTGLKPILEDVDENAADPLRAIAEKYLHLPCSVMTPNTRRFEMLRNLAAEYRVDCVVELIWQACLTYDVEAHHVKRVVEEELGLPYLRIETDYSPSDSARIATRVEALFETVRGRRA